MKIGPFENASGLADASIRKRMGRGEVCTVFVQPSYVVSVEPNRLFFVRCQAEPLYFYSTVARRWGRPQVRPQARGLVVRPRRRSGVGAHVGARPPPRAPHGAPAAAGRPHETRVSYADDVDVRCRRVPSRAGPRL